jgi:hypothetical protein
MLAVDPEQRDLSIDRELVKYVEKKSRQGGAKVVHLEILILKEFTLPSKERSLFRHGIYSVCGTWDSVVSVLVI